MEFSPGSLSGLSWFIGDAIPLLAFNGAVNSWQRAPLGGLTGITASNQLVNPAIGGSLDARVKNTSADIYGAGANFTYPMGTYWGTGVPGPDILNTSRPVSGRFDVGAEMLSGGSGPPPFPPQGIGGGRSFW